MFGLAELDSELGNDLGLFRGYAQLNNRAIYDQTGISTYQRIECICLCKAWKVQSAIEFHRKALGWNMMTKQSMNLPVSIFDQEDYQKAVLYFKQIDTISPDFLKDMVRL